MTEAVPKPASWRVAAWLALICVVSAVNYASQLADVETPDDVAYRYSSSVGLVIQYGIFLGIILLIARGLPRKETFALRRPRSWGRSLKILGAGLLMIWVAGGVFSLFLDATEEQNLVPDGWDSSRAGAFVAFFVGVTFIGPVVEELMFRGLGFAVLAPYGTLVVVLGTGTLFGLYHGLFEALPVLIVFGIVIGWVRMKTESLYPPIVLHAIFNGVALIASVTLID